MPPPPPTPSPLTTLLFPSPPITTPSTETHHLFTLPPPPTQNLGFLAPTAPTLALTIARRDFHIAQSPGLLRSDLPGGTTGAVVWRVGREIAEWVGWEGCFLFRGVGGGHRGGREVGEGEGRGLGMGRESTVLELGCGVSGLLALVGAGRVRKWVATDQEYVFRLLRGNVEENLPRPVDKGGRKKGRRGKKEKEKEGKAAVGGVGLEESNIQLLALDWESSIVSELPALIGLEAGRGVDLVLACDCIYNDALIAPFVTTCADVCRLNRREGEGIQTVCLVAQQLRSDEVFETWLEAFVELFWVWRVPDALLTEGLREGSGFVVHIGVLREEGG